MFGLDFTHVWGSFQSSASSTVKIITNVLSCCFMPRRMSMNVLRIEKQGEFLSNPAVVMLNISGWRLAP